MLPGAPLRPRSQATSRRNIVGTALPVARCVVTRSADLRPTTRSARREAARRISRRAGYNGPFTLGPLPGGPSCLRRADKDRFVSFHGVRCCTAPASRARSPRPEPLSKPLRSLRPPSRPPYDPAERSTGAAARLLSLARRDRRRTAWPALPAEFRDRANEHGGRAQAYIDLVLSRPDRAIAGALDLISNLPEAS
jgi:hypothetical protein